MAAAYGLILEIAFADSAVRALPDWRGRRTFDEAQERHVHLAAERALRPCSPSSSQVCIDGRVQTLGSKAITYKHSLILTTDA